MHNCDICGSKKADIICTSCGRITCRRCYSDHDGACLKCVRKLTLHRLVSQFTGRGLSSSGLNMLGLLLVFLGLLIVTMSFTPEEGEGMLPFFPFIANNGIGAIVSILSVAFLSLFVIMSVLPWYMFMKRRRVQPHWDAFRWDTENRESEEMEYMITIKIPPGLEKTVYVEEDEIGSIDIYSHTNSTFHRSYDLPSGFEVADYKYEYDGDYLVLRLKLKNSSDRF